jgi:hypothetical protein
VTGHTNPTDITGTPQTWRSRGDIFQIYTGREGHEFSLNLAAAIIPILHVAPTIHAIERLEKLSVDFEGSDGNGEED